MDFEYGCATVNKFAFLDENEVEDPSDLLAQVSLAKETTKKDTKKVDSKGKKVDSKKSAGKDKKPLQASDNAVKKTGDNKDAGKKMGDRNQRPAGDLAKENRGPRNDNRGPRPQGDRPQGDRPQGDRPQRRPQGDRPPRQPRTDADGNVIEEGEGFRGGYRGPRGAGGYRGGARGPRRDEGEGEHRRFERHSGSDKTGIKAVDKKDGAGKGNWGTATDEVVIEESMGEVATGETKDWAERVDENEEKKVMEPEEDTPNFMTLEEYKALKSAVNKRNDFNIRRPGEGEDQSKWGKTYLLPKKEESEEESEEEEEEEEEVEEDENDVKRKELIKSMQSAFKFESSQVSSSRGGRGGPRGGAGRRDGGDRREGGDRRPKPEATEATPEAVAPATESAPVEAAAPADVQASPSEKKSHGFGGGERRGGARGGAQGGRGGRGGAGGRPAPSGRGGAQKSAPKFDDEKDFPTLGK